MMDVHLTTPLRWTLLVCAAAVVQTGLGDVSEGAAAQHSSAQETKLCLSRIAPLAKAEGYGALCTSIGALYQQQQNAASSLLALKEENERMHTSHTSLEQQNQELQVEVAELKQHKNRRENEWQNAAKKFQAGVASRDAQWQSTVKQIETAAAKKYQAGIASRDAQWQATVKHIESSKDAHWKAIVQRLESEKKALELQATESQKQKEAMEASTSVGTQSRRTILLALSREKEKSHAESKEIQGLMEQIKALQNENAQLVQRCVAGNS
jgi:chromosome segregation ATPase